MTKRMIDADALLARVDKKSKNTSFYESFTYPELKSIIQELAMTANT